MPIFNNALAGASGGAGGGGGDYVIERSLRFNKGHDAQLVRTPSSAGNRTKWSWSAWVKRSTLGGNQNLFTGYRSGNETLFSFDPSNRLEFYNWTGGYSGRKTSTAVFRDCSSWYHIVLVWDTGNSTAADRIKFIVNGVRVEVFTVSADPNQNTQSTINDAYSNVIGDHLGSANYNFDGYLANIQFVDGQALDYTAFAQFDSNGVLQPIKYAGTYGTNGFHLDFKDNSSNAALGNDAAGSNNWTVNNLTASTASISYTSLTSATGTGGVSGINPSYPISRMYDGNTGTYMATNFANISSNPAILTLTFSPGIPFSSTVRANFYKGPGETVTYNFNGEGSTSWSSTGVNWQTVKSGSGVMTSLVISRQKTNTNGGSVEVYGLEVDGVLLTGNLVVETDSFVDTPSNGDPANDTGAGNQITGNYATLNPLAKGTSLTLSNGNLDVSSSGHSTANATIAVTAGMKVYVELTRTGGSSSGGFGFTSNVAPYSGYPGQATGLWYVYDNGINFVYNFEGSYTQYGAKIGTGDCVQLAIDYDAGKAWIGINNTWFTTSNGTNGNPSTGANPTFTFSTSLPLFPLVHSGGYTYSCNFGQHALKYSAPTNFKTLCTASLPTPTIEEPSKYFDTKIWTGDGASSRTIPTSFDPDFVWLKNRGVTGRSHYLYDAVRGFGANKELVSNSTVEEGSSNHLTQNHGYVSGTTATGFTLAAGATNSTYTNDSGNTYVGWAWDAGSSTVSNTDGSITSQVRAQPSAGQSIVSYSGSGSNATVGHGCNSAPEFILVKMRSSNGYDWCVYHSGLSSVAHVLDLARTNAEENNPATFNSTAPTSSVFSVGTRGSINNGGSNFIAYCFSPVNSYSAIGSYIGNGSSDGTFVHTGFRPAFVILKASSATGSWIISDNKINNYNVTGKFLAANSSAVEDSGGNIDFLSNGFKLRLSSSGFNGSGITYVYYAVAEHPFKTSRAR
jgi:hypothetical protein